jgi:hypothetical protein
MKGIIRALDTELYKLRRTLVLWLAAIGPLSIVALQMLTVYQHRAIYTQREGNAWLWFGEAINPYWTWMALPLFIGLQAALLAGLEHRSNQWKHLYALPVSRGAVYAAKQLAGLLLIGLSTFCLVAFTLLGGLALQAMEPGLGFTWDVPWARLIRFGLGVYLASWLTIAIHIWLSQRWKSFVVSMSVAIAASVFALFAAKSRLAILCPWVLPRLAAETFATGEVRGAVLAVGSLAGLAFAAWGCRDVTGRDVT